jgi:hypothetical protein
MKLAKVVKLVLFTLEYLCILQRFNSLNKETVMERWHRAFSKNDKEFKELFGVKKAVFHEMLAVVTIAREERLRRGGRKPKLSAGDQLFLTLQYWREYRTMAHLAFDFGVAKSTVSDTIVAVEELTGRSTGVLIQDQSFHLPGKKALCR